MSLLAGIFWRKPGPRPESWKASLTSRLSRDPGDKPRIADTGAALFTKIDIGAFGAEAFLEEADGSLAMLAGEPLLDDGEDAGERDRGRELAILHSDLKRNETKALRQSQGIFAGASYDAASETLTLVSDKGGIRPLWYYCDEEKVVFASKLSIFEEIAEIPKRVDMRGTTETAAFGFPLADRTAYADVRSLRPGEVIRFTRTDRKTSAYWRWDEQAKEALPEEESLDVIAARIGRAVKLLNRGDRNTTALLSGGMDSRCIVTFLREQGTQVHTFNFAPTNSLDHVLGDGFAAKAGTLHVSEPMIPGTDFDLLNRLRKRLREFPIDNAVPERPGTVWLGVGTASSIGLHRMTEPMLKLFRKGEKGKAIEEFLKRFNYTLPRRVFQPKMLPQLEGWLRQGVLEEMETSSSADLAHDFRIFILLNYERHHLDKTFQDIDLHRMEPLCPFLNWNFVESVFAVSVDGSFQRRLYNKLIWKLPPLMTSMAWQTYPGHPACPLPLPAGVPDQWAQGNPYRVKNRLRWTRSGSTILMNSPFPHEILNWKNLFRSTLFQWLGLRDYSYAFKPALAFSKHWKIAKGMHD